MDEVTKTRADTLARFATHAAGLFALRSERRAVLLVLSQFPYNSDDDVHARCVVSERELPMWPHECHDGDDHGMESTHPGEECYWCGPDDLDLTFEGSNGDAMVRAFAPLCREAAHEDMDLVEAYVPYAIARRREDGVAIEIVGAHLRSSAGVIGVPAHADADDPQLRALLEQVHARTRDDAPRAVLADYLLARDDPRGEVIARALAGVAHDEWLAPNLARWIAPLGAVIPPGGARFERGFVARVEVFASDSAACERVRGARAWATVEQLRYLRHSQDVLDPAMRALRDVGTVADAGIATLVKARRAWTIERLSAIPITAEAVVALLRAATLPRLRELALGVTWLPEVFGTKRRLRLDRLVLISSQERLAPETLRDHRASLGVPWLANVEYGHDFEPAGWELAFGPDERVQVRLAGWHGQATLRRLAGLVRGVGGTVELVDSPYFAFTPYDVAYVREHAGGQRIVTVRA
jgi:hypothetical protein